MHKLLQHKAPEAVTLPAIKTVEESSSDELDVPYISTPKVKASEPQYFVYKNMLNQLQSISMKSNKKPRNNITKILPPDGDLVLDTEHITGVPEVQELSTWEEPPIPTAPIADVSLASVCVVEPGTQRTSPPPPEAMNEAERTLVEVPSLAIPSPLDTRKKEQTFAVKVSLDL